MELELSVFGLNFLQKEQCASTSYGVKGAKKPQVLSYLFDFWIYLRRLRRIPRRALLTLQQNVF